jgi:hydrogenase maturation protein HypF
MIPQNVHKTKLQRLRVAIRGAVQGVGFRPFVFHLADEMHLAGWVNNSPQGVNIEAEGQPEELQAFLLRLEKEKPAHSFIQSLEPSWLDPVGYKNFEIRQSELSGKKAALVLPDIATCGECVRELFDAGNRRYRYPFINCTHCGPRFSIILNLPYDRTNTTMGRFRMCARCLQEYGDPSDRRFHAQPNACPNCGPQIYLWDDKGRMLADKEEALNQAVASIRSGKIVALKGIGGFQLLTDARNAEAVRRLRQRKHREGKPFALMYPNLDEARRDCAVSPLEERLLVSSEAPIVLLERLGTAAADDAIAPRNPYLGVMLPYSPLHHLIMADLQAPVVATSGNLSDEPICIDEQEALERLRGIADVWLVHDRPIARHVDDSVGRVLMDRELVIRRARGYAPLPVTLQEETPPLLSVGAHLKNSIAMATGKEVFISQHIGDLETAAALDAFQRVISDFETLYQAVPETVACDMHPQYLSSQFARRLGQPVVEVQHHYAHALSCMTENELTAPVLAVSWDGTGYGLDGTIWGGEFLRIDENGFERFSHLRAFALPGGEKAVKEPRRTAMGLLYEIFGEKMFAMDLAPLKGLDQEKRSILNTMLRNGVNSPRTSSAGRLFDAIASLAGLRQEVSFEGQAAMELEFAAAKIHTGESYPVRKSEDGIDWEPMVRAILEELALEATVNEIAAKFHNTLVEAIVQVAHDCGLEKVILSGGCFQNRRLSERAVLRLRREGFHPYWHQRIPPNDGGIALGQVMAVVRSKMGVAAQCV